jgi:micrococcal nuclease
MKTFMFFLIAFASFKTVGANEITARVVSVIDGNTLEIQSSENGLQRLVLEGIDCPELEQEFGIEAKAFLEKLVLRKQVQVSFRGKDRTGNYIAVVLVDDDDLRIELLKGGFAWTMEKNPSSDLESYRYWAQQKERGLWKTKNPTPPWTFRRQQSMLQPKSS